MNLDLERLSTNIGWVRSFFPFFTQLLRNILITFPWKVEKKKRKKKQEGHSGPESLTCTMCTSLVQWKAMFKTIWSMPSGFRQEDFFLFSLYNDI